MESIQKQIGQNLKSIRKMRSLSLDQVSALTGVSKGMLSQVEKGESSPTVSTLWKIANGLEVSFSSLVEEEGTDFSVVRRSEKTAVTEHHDLYHVISYFPFDKSKKFEIYQMELLPGCSHLSERHHGGAEEYIMVSEGKVKITIGKETILLGKGDAVKFKAIQEHLYENAFNTPASCFLLIYYP
ncbi:helix-turn-helix domain-containing protein [Metabacillus sp. RGM 3146]|uniref:helix-turn-helix domain-containing protein n=1 Tax=Metabacillus sp. RGM 3146 TaxID=3401092 RepID=UPI003B9C66DD